jgi:hypothetical protein
VVKLAASGLLLAVAFGVPAQGASSGQADRKQLRPHRGKSVIVTPRKGTVILYRRGNRKVTGAPESLPVGEPVRIPLGSVLDTTAGKVTVVSAVSPFGTKTTQGSFSRGVFGVHQTGSDTAITLGGNGARVCSTPRELRSRAPGKFMVLAGRSAARAATPFGRPSPTPVDLVAKDRCTASKVVAPPRRYQLIDLGSREATARRAHRLFGGRGRFRTVGRHSSATVRGRVVAR